MARLSVLCSVRLRRLVDTFRGVLHGEAEWFVAGKSLAQ
jgi:hypothetical protein